MENRSCLMTLILSIWMGVSWALRSGASQVFNKEFLAACLAVRQSVGLFSPGLHDGKGKVFYKLRVGRPDAFPTTIAERKKKNIFGG